MSSTADPTVQMIFVDLLFLGLAAGMAFWFRAWLREQKGEMDRRLQALETQQQSLARVSERLSSACRTLERQVPPVQVHTPARGRTSGVEAPAPPAVADPSGGDARTVAAPSDAPRPAAGVPPMAGRRMDTPASRSDRQWEELSDRSREAYRRARDLLDQGMSSAEIARRVGLGVAEVNVLRRMREAGRR